MWPDGENGQIAHVTSPVAKHIPVWITNSPPRFTGDAAVACTHRAPDETQTELLCVDGGERAHTHRTSVDFTDELIEVDIFICGDFSQNFVVVMSVSTSPHMKRSVVRPVYGLSQIWNIAM